MRRSLPLLILLAAVTLLGEEVPLTPPSYAPAVGWQFYPSIALPPHGAGFVAWNDGRSGYGASIFGSGVNPDGSLLQPRGENLIGRLDNEWLAHSRSAVVWDGRGFVVFANETGLSTTARRLDALGHPAGAPVTVVDDGLTGGAFRPPFAASNGSTIVIASGIQKTDGVVVLDHDLNTIRTITWQQLGLPGFHPVLASDGHDYLVVEYYRSAPESFVGAVRLSSNGEVISRGGAIAGVLMNPAAATLVWTGSEYLYIWSDYYDGRDGQISKPIGAYHLDRDGHPKSGDITLLVERANSVGAVLDRSGRVIVAFDRNAGETSEILAFTTDGTTASVPQKLGDSTLSYGPSFSVAASPETTLLAWHTSHGVRVSQVEAAALAGAGSLAQIAKAPSADPQEQTESATDQHHFAVDRQGPAQLAAWEELDGSNPSRVVLAKIDEAGRATSTPRTPFPASRAQILPALTWNGATYLMTWFEPLGSATAELFAARLDSSGAPIDPQPLNLGEAAVYSIRNDFRTQLEPTDVPAAVLWDGGAFLVVRTVYRVIDATPSLPLRLTRITADGLVLDREGIDITALTRGVSQWKPVIARTAGVTFVVWQEGSPSYVCQIECTPPPPAMILGMPLTNDGLPMQSLPFILSTEEYDAYPDVAADGVRLLVVWNHEGTVRARRFLRDGSPIDREAITLGLTHRYARPSVTSVGTAFVATWEIGEQGYYSSPSLQDVGRAVLDGNGLKSGRVSVGRDRAEPIAWQSAAGAMLTYDWYSAADAFGVGRLYSIPADSVIVRRRIAGGQ